MTKFSITKKNGSYTLMCRDHAIPDVCRGVSALIYACAQTLMIEHKLQRDEEVKVSLISGEAYITVYPKREFEERTKLILRTCALGMMCIAETYPQELEVSALCVLDDCLEKSGEK